MPDSCRAHPFSSASVQIADPFGEKLPGGFLALHSPDKPLKRLVRHNELLNARTSAMMGEQVVTDNCRPSRRKLKASPAKRNACL
jgi:hypothetical protein